MTKINFNKEYALVHQFLSNSNLRKIEYQTLKLNLLILAIYFPQKRDFLFKKIASIQIKIDSKNESEINLAQKVINLINS